MVKLNGHWVAKRIGIVEHYKNMSAYEIALFDTYCLLSNKQTFCCFRTLEQLERILGWNRRTIMKAKKGLIKIGFIETRGQTGVYIPKLIKYSNSVLDTPDSVSGALSDETQIVHEVHHDSVLDTQNSVRDTPIIEDVIIDEEITTSQLFSKDSDPMKMSDLLFSLIQKNDPRARSPNFQKWAQDFDKLNRIDKRPWDEVEMVVRWVQEDDFEKVNVLSPGKLRKRYTSLLLKTKQNRQKKKNGYIKLDDFVKKGVV